MDLTSGLYITAEAIIGILSCVGNGLVLIAIARNRKLQTVTNCFIASLALADFLVGIIVAPLAALSYQGLPHHFLGCVFTNSIVVAFTQVSIFNLLAVAFERFIAIKHPFAYRRHLFIKRALLINLGVWCIGMLFGLLPLFGWNLHYLKGEDWRCNFVSVIDMNYVVYFHFFGCIMVPLFIITAIYVYIFHIIRKQMKQIAVLEIVVPRQDGSSPSQLKREIKAAKSLAIVIIFFAISWIPIHTLNTMSLLCAENCPYPIELLLATIVVSHANSAINPFLYAYGNSNFKLAFQRMFSRNSDSLRSNTHISTNFNPRPKSSSSNNQHNKTTQDNPTQHNPHQTPYVITKLYNEQQPNESSDSSNG